MQLITGVTESQVSFAVKQRMPKTFDEAVTVIMQTEAHFTTARVASTTLEETTVGTNLALMLLILRRDALLDLVSNLAEKIEKIEARLDHSSPPRPQRQQRQTRRDPSTINCHQPGHWARGCAVPPF